MVNDKTAKYPEAPPWPTLEYNIAIKQIEARSSNSTNYPMKTDEIILTATE